MLKNYRPTASCHRYLYKSDGKKVLEDFITMNKGPTQEIERVKDKLALSFGVFFTLFSSKTRATSNLKTNKYQVIYVIFVIKNLQIVNLEQTLA